MAISLKEDIRPVSELKKNTRAILEQVHKTGRPVILTMNGKANSVIMDVESYEKQIKAANLANLLLEAERDIAEDKVRPVKTFMKDFKRDHKLQS